MNTGDVSNTSVTLTLDGDQLLMSTVAKWITHTSATSTSVFCHPLFRPNPTSHISKHLLATDVTCDSTIHNFHHLVYINMWPIWNFSVVITTHAVLCLLSPCALNWMTSRLLFRFHYNYDFLTRFVTFKRLNVCWWRHQCRKRRWCCCYYVCCW